MIASNRISSNSRTRPALDDIAIIAGARTPFAKAGGALREVSAADLARRAIQETLYRAAFAAERLDEVIIGNVVMPADSTNLARVAALWAGVPQDVPGLTVQRNCASGLESIATAALRISAGWGKAMIAGGAESMSNAPLLFPQAAMAPMARLSRAKSAGRKVAAGLALRPRYFKPVAALELGLTDPTCGLIMGKTAEVLVQEWNITRAQQDQFALESHLKATAAIAAGRLAEEIIPVFAGRHFDAVAEDVGPRPNQTLEALAALRPIFDRRDGSVTVGNSCQITDGAVAMLVADGAMARAQGVVPLGYVRAYAYAALDPARMGLGPVYAISQLLAQTGMELADIDLFEINEAFAGQVLACLKTMDSRHFARDHLGRDEALGALDPARLNVNGGAIALGHPVGATGSRLALTLLMEMRRRGVHRGVAALCVGGGQGAAVLLERTD